MVDNSRKYSKMYYYLWRNKVVVFNDSISKHYSLRIEITAVEDYLRRAEMI